VTWDADIAAVGSILAEPARCRILLALADGRALPATTLAAEAHVAASTASGHLGKLVDAGWLAVEAHGRHRYYRIARDDVGEVMEAAARIAPPAPVRSLGDDLRRQRLRRARTCYSHLAGKLGVGLLDRLLDVGWIDGHDGTFRPGIDQLASSGTDVVYRVTDAGSAALGELGIDVVAGSGARHCVDWTEQRHHLAGAVGTGLARACFDRGWIARSEAGRIVELTETGAAALADLVGFHVCALDL
jgi:DNA-binding transcriptional ArsR family regulator